ncbi:MAG: hypothetical protein K1W06_02750 [Lachnospiraceae bacterium]
MRLKSKQNVLTEAVSELKDVDYTKVPGLDSIYHRLSKGREEFAGVFEKNIKAVMQISSLDLAMQHQTEKIDDIYHKISKATETIFGSPAGSSYSAGHTNNRHEELTNTIIEISSKTEKIHKKIGTGQEELTVIKNLSEQTIEDSKEMQKDMDQLVGIINTMTGIIAGIDTISLQTNLLALNASIEAAKAGQAGKGFAVVATEIRGLAEETQKLTSNMGDFVEEIKNASQKSMESSAETIHALSAVTDKIGQVWELNNDNKKHISEVSEAISSIAALSEEITSTMTEMENQLIDSAGYMLEVEQEIKKSTEPVIVIEQILDDSVKQMGIMSEDAFYHMEDGEFAGYMENAISAHNTWLNNLEKMVKERSVLPLQLDPSKCGFGHFYNAMVPKIPGVLPIWIGLGAKHKKFHGYGAEVINAIENNDYRLAEQVYIEAREYSKNLISDMEKIIDICINK